MKELCFLLGPDEVLLWSDLRGTVNRMEDQRDRWDRIWQFKESLVEIAHCHPCGLLAFSYEDETTMEAIDAALGRALRYSVVTPDRVLLRAEGAEQIMLNDPWWAPLMRQAAGMQ